MDSTTLAYVAKDMGYEIYALHMNYGQRTERRELQSAKTIANLLDAKEFVEVNLGYLTQFGDSSLTDHSIEVEEFDESRIGIPNTYVPFRNANLLSIATSFAESRKADAIFIGVQSLDYSGYPDCRPQFIEAFQNVIDTGTRDGTRIRLLTPFISMTKRDILARGLVLDVPYQHTWSCYQDGEMACGVCGSCHFRKEAFRAAGVRDPIPYRGEK
jgi:7-cyano-7-deazaguanine synthase